MYHVCLSDGTLFTEVSDTTMLQMMEKLDVDNVASADTGALLYLKPKKPDKIVGITRADKPITPWYRPAEASQQYVDAIGPIVTPENWNFTVVVLYDYEMAWVGRFHGEDVAFNFFEQRVKNKRTVMLYKGNRLVCRAFNGVKEAQQ
jgi:hypothetical protein